MLRVTQFTPETRSYGNNNELSFMQTMKLRQRLRRKRVQSKKVHDLQQQLNLPPSLRDKVEFVLADGSKSVKVDICSLPDLHASDAYARYCMISGYKLDRQVIEFEDPMDPNNHLTKREELEALLQSWMKGRADRIKKRTAAQVKADQDKLDSESPSRQAEGALGIWKMAMVPDNHKEFSHGFYNSLLGFCKLCLQLFCLFSSCGFSMELRL